LDFDAKSDDKCPVEVDRSFLKYLKAHQREGIKFLYKSSIESLHQMLVEKDHGGGGIFYITIFSY
jgi:hypothetical protein